MKMGGLAVVLYPLRLVAAPKKIDSRRRCTGETSDSFGSSQRPYRNQIEVRTRHHILALAFMPPKGSGAKLKDEGIMHGAELDRH